jgi:hypothetical protein
MVAGHPARWYEVVIVTSYLVIFAAVNIIALPIRLIRYVFDSTTRGYAHFYRYFHPHNHD